MKLDHFIRTGKRSASDAVRSISEYVGIQRYSKPGLHDLDAKLSKYLNFREGFFIECGANDGFRQSNTYYLEKFLAWNGLLIEPVPELYERCKLLRKNSICVRSALVGPDHSGEEIKVSYAGLMSVVEGAFGSEEHAQKHVQEGLRIQQLSAQTFSAPASTLSQILDRVNITKEIDFLSLDVEGYEKEALSGLDLSRHRPRFILVEARDKDAIYDILKPRYRLLDQLTHHDYLFGTN